ncbi:MAG: sulfite exporter TauE/SafE family protein [Pseudomonadota bacterium]
MIAAGAGVAYLGVGAVAGFFAGLLGIGGGIVMVPVLALLFELGGMPRDYIFQLALGTSMAAILFSSLASLRAHHRHGAVIWSVVGRITPGILLGTALGTALARHVPTRSLALFFAAFVVFVALQMTLNFRPTPSRSLPGPMGLTAVGVGIGIVSSLVAIGGGAMTVPFLTWCNVRVRDAIGTSAAVGFPIALGGTVGYIANGLTAPGLPGGSLGFIYLPALVWILAASVFAAPLGARTAHRLPVATLKRIFAGVLVILAAKMLWSLYTS